jgi:hypothetical protein
MDDSFFIMTMIVLFRFGESKFPLVSNNIEISTPGSVCQSAHVQ